MERKEIVLSRCRTLAVGVVALVWPAAVTASARPSGHASGAPLRDGHAGTRRARRCRTSSHGRPPHAGRRPVRAAHARAASSRGSAAPRRARQRPHVAPRPAQALRGQVERGRPRVRQPRRSRDAPPRRRREAPRSAPDGLAVAPACAPPAVQQVIAAGQPDRRQAVQVRRRPRPVGGLRLRLLGLDVLRAARRRPAQQRARRPATSSPGARPGQGTWITIYGNSGHAFMVDRRPALRHRLEHARPSGPHWSDEDAPVDGYVARHPEGL